jgi:hypothetical protein
LYESGAAVLAPDSYNIGHYVTWHVFAWARSSGLLVGFGRQAHLDFVLVAGERRRRTLFLNAGRKNHGASNSAAPACCFADADNLRKSIEYLR